MNLFQLVIKQMRQRALGTWLTLFSVLLGVALAISIMIMRRESQNLFAQTDFGYDVLLGPPKGSPLQLTLNTVYHMDTSPGIIPYSIYADMQHKGPPLPGHVDFHRYVKQAVPFMVGDSYHGRRIVGTSPLMFGAGEDGNRVANPWQYRDGKSYELAEGKVFAPKKFEAVIGSDIAASLHLHLYDPKLSPQENEKAGGAFRATHGMPGPNEKPDIHKPIWNVVGILQPTHTANDRVLFIPFVSLYAIAEHESGMIDQALMKAGLDPSKIPPDRVDDALRSLGIDPQKLEPSIKKKFNLEHPAAPTTQKSSADVGELLESAKAAPPPTTAEADDGVDPDVYHLDPATGDIIPDLPPDEWSISAILVQSRGTFAEQQLMYNFKVIDDRATAVNPAEVMRGFFETFLAGATNSLLIISVLVIVVAAVGILVSIYNSVTARKREIAILRALGATRAKILVLICVEAALIGLVGGILGLLAGHGLAAVGSVFLNHLLGQGINWMAVDRMELLYLIGVIVLSTLAGLVPALSAYRTPVATNLVAG